MSLVKNGDAIAIAGDYQHRALHEGPGVQRFWHHAKFMAIRRFLPPMADDYVLDVGCGSGTVSEFLGRQGARVLGLDVNPAALDFASRRYGSVNVCFERQLVDQPMPVAGAADKIYSLEVIEHIHTDQGARMLAEFRTALRPGGRVLLTTPNYRSPWPIIEWLMDRSGRFPPLEDDQHVAKYHRRNLAELVESVGFEIETLTTMNFLAPWLAPLHWAGAERLAAWEMEHAWVPGCNLVCVARRPA